MMVLVAASEKAVVGEETENEESPMEIHERRDRDHRVPAGLHLSLD
jgi:hypothetical protein